MMLSKCFGRVQRLLLWDMSMLLPRNSHPQLYQNALATSVEASSSGNPNFSINDCLDVLAEVEVASTRSVFKNLLFLQFLGNNGIVFVSEGKNRDYNSNSSYAHIVLQMLLLTQLELSLNSPSFHPVFGPGFTLYITSFIGIHKVKKFCYISV